MPQHIVMSGDGQADIGKLRDIIYGLMDFGIIHEDLVNTIEEMILEVVTHQVGLGGLQPDYDENKEDYSDEKEYLQDNFGSAGVFEIIDMMTNEEAMLTAKCVRELVSTALFSESYNIEVDYEELLERLK